MLDSDTKRRIDTCRDILVGKVPDPKSQVEQITIALIYKFMDDMDAEAEAMGGKRSFFTGEYAKYGWSKLMAPNMGGFDVLSLYSEAIQKMNENPGVPVLFRDIFKNAYLPYRDPETLRSFLKEINGFTYDHSERLGDAFEYLLSVLGSQGEAGQFRTPRHIIDFMVEITDPHKDETILDPACGTAGFLISSYKHILKHNTKGYKEQQDREAYDEKGVPLEALTLDSPLHYKGDLLTPDDKKRLAANIHGYDISPDMVRLSLVNMYLHGFTSPHIDEYDTLTSDEKWNELADVILANPPFMSPKGGIKPHKRFSVDATRSEVLFVDYIAEHLTPNGRAAVVVPEGIIFQSGTAYKQLREMLVKNYLVSVISLPAGVFNPYSGVKTSILVLDKRLSKKSDAILFAKIDNDGYNLGAQRRPIDKNDLPAAARNIKSWLESLRSGVAFDVEHIANLNLVPKEKFGEDGEWNLVGDRYVVDACKNLSAYPIVKLGDLFEDIKIGGTPSRANTSYFGGGIPWVSIRDMENTRVITKTKETLSRSGVENSNCKLIKAGSLLMSFKLTVGRTSFAGIDLYTNEAIAAFEINDRIDLAYLSHLLPIAVLQDESTNVFDAKSLNKAKIKELKIPLPPLEVQKEIVTEIEGYQKIIDGARQVVENYQPRIPIHPDWPQKTVGEVSAKITKGSSPNWQGVEYTSEDKGILFITSENVGMGELLLTKPKYVEQRFNEIEPKSILQKGDVLTNIVGASIGRTAIFDRDVVANINQAVCLIRPDTDAADSRYLMYVLNSPEFIQKLLGNSVENARANVSMGVLGSLTVPVPDLETQRTIVAQIEEEQRLVNANKELIRLFEDKIKAIINRVWGEAEQAVIDDAQPITGSQAQ
jgi:type I restriction enzyme M protein